MAVTTEKLRCSDPLEGPAPSGPESERTKTEDPATPDDPDKRESGQWTGKTRGGFFGNWFFLQIIRLFGLRLAYLFLVPVAAYFLIASPTGVRSSHQYLKLVLGPQPWWKWPFLIYRHFFSFGMTLLDRAAVLMGNSETSYIFDGETTLQQTLAENKGLIIMSAHLGSWEVGGNVLTSRKSIVNLVMLDNEADHIRRMFKKHLDSQGFRVLTSTTSPFRSVPILAALQRKEIVAIHGDRAFGGASVNVPFLGGTAAFPVGGYVLASVSGAPILHAFTVRERTGEYRFFCFPPQHVDKLPRTNRDEALASHVRVYAERLESVARQYPFQWYNFFPFWREEK